MVLETSKWWEKKLKKKKANKKLNKKVYVCSGFFGPDAIRPFDAKDVENDLKEKKFKTRDLELAVRQALNPALLTQEIAEEEEEEEEEDPPVEEKQKKKPVTKKTTQKKKDTPTVATKRRSRNLQLDQDMEDETGALDNLKKRVSLY